MAENVIDTFGTSAVVDYDRLFADLGLKPIDQGILSRMDSPSRLLMRGIDFAHVDFDKFLDAAKNRKDIAVMTGIKPTNQFHLGSKMSKRDPISMITLNDSPEKFLEKHRAKKKRFIPKAKKILSAD